MFTGFAWNPVGVALADTWWRPASAIIGTYGLSSLVVLFGGVLWLLSRRDWRAPAALAAGALLLLAWPLPPTPASLTMRPLRIVQPNIGQEDKWREGLEREAFARLGQLSLGGTAGPRLLLWPEVAVPVPLQVAPLDPRERPLTLPATAQAAAYLRPGDVLVTGAFALVADPQGRIAGSTNSVMPIDSAGQIHGRYDKAHLVPYGEYLPMRPVLSAIGLSQLAPGVGDTLPGPGPRTLAIPGFGTAGIQVCYEIIFSGEVIDRAHRPDFLFNPSNDAWFGRWGPPQHLAQARLRAAEEGIPVLRSTPTGISAIIDARGRLLASLPWRQAGVIDGILPPAAAAPTVFARFGNVIPLSLAFGLLIIAVGMDARRRYRADI
jgi:apolipoprotein N-acyltransferase